MALILTLMMVTLMVLIMILNFKLNFKRFKETNKNLTKPSNTIKASTRNRPKQIIISLNNNQVCNNYAKTHSNSNSETPALLHSSASKIYMEDLTAIVNSQDEKNKV